jgi:hypothetical protein
MHKLQRSWVRFQHPSAQWNLRGGRWNSFEYGTKKKYLKKIIIIPETRSVAPISAVLKGGPLSVTFNRTHFLSEIPNKRPATLHDCLIARRWGKMHWNSVWWEIFLFVLGRQEQPKQAENHLYRLDKPNEPAKDEPLSFLFFESHLPQFQQSAGAIPL